uniref:non-specific serine/threonine protein kinase n=1 Tax=Chrysotila carterae TaxID=13221 RepID=A0A7S4BAD0_CHRCT
MSLMLPDAPQVVPSQERKAAPVAPLKTVAPEPEPTSSITNTIKRNVDKAKMAKEHGEALAEEQLSSFRAFVLADFEAEEGSYELTVFKGDFVTVEVDSDEPPPEGWCVCSHTDAEGETRYGLVPWYFLVSAAHAEMQAAFADPGAGPEAAAPVPKPADDNAESDDEGLRVDETPRANKAQVEFIDIMVMRNEAGALGIDIDERNLVRRVADSARPENHKLRVGDVIIAVNGHPLSGKRLLEVMEAGQPGYVLRVERRQLGKQELDSLSEGIMTTMRLQAVAAGFGEQDSARHYVSLPGRQVTTGGRVHALRAQQRTSAKSMPVTPSLGETQEKMAHNVEDGAHLKQVKHTIKVNRKGDRLGIDINENNMIVRILPDTPASDDGLLKQNDVVIAVNGVALNGRWIAHALPPDKPSYDFTVVREEWTTPKGKAADANKADAADIYSLKSWALADMHKAVRAGAANDDAASSVGKPDDDDEEEEEDHEEDNADGAGAVFPVSGGTVPAWVFAQYKEMAATPVNDLDNPQLARPRAPPGSRPKTSLKPKGNVWATPEGEDDEESSAKTASSKPSSTATSTNASAASASATKNSAHKDQQAAIAAQAAAAVAARPKRAPAPSYYAAGTTSSSAVPAKPKSSSSGVDLVERGPGADAYYGSGGGGGGNRSAAVAALASRSNAVEAPAAAKATATPAGTNSAQASSKPAAEGVIQTELTAKPADLMGGAKYRKPPKPPEYVSTMRMEDMLRIAMEAAADDEKKANEFDSVLSKYKQHPGVLRREREAKEARKERHEKMNKPAYERQRARIPSGVTLGLTSLDDLVDAGCDWDLAEEIVRFPMLKWLRASADDIEKLPIVATLAYSLDRRMTEEQARACCYALPARFTIDRKEQWGNKGMREAWLESQHRIFDEMEESGFGDGGGDGAADAAAAAATVAAAAGNVGRSPQPAAGAALQMPLAGAGGSPAGAPQVKPLREAESLKALEAGEVFTPRTKAIGEKVLPARASDVGGYKETTLVERIGQGTYGSVYRGVCGEEEVAVKVMALQADTAEDIKREIKIMRECSCEHIVAYRDAFLREHQMRSSLWVVMEYCHVGSTLDVMRRQNAPLVEAHAAYICRGVLLALDYLHTERKTIHRDIKAANILVNNDSFVKLADLGVAAQLYNTMSKRGTMIGTPHWMAPETLAQASGDGGKYGMKVDIWGVGITAIELVQMSPPFADTKSVFQVRTLNRRARVDTHATTPSRECGDESTHALRGAPRKMAHATAG